MRRPSRRPGWHVAAVRRAVVLALLFAGSSPVAMPGAATTAATATTVAAQAPACAFEYVGQAKVATGTRFEGIEVGGLSGIDFDAASGRYWTISDDRSVHGPARLYRLSLDLARFRRANDVGDEAVQFEQAVPLRDGQGDTYVRNSVDPEAVRHLPGRPRLLWSFEGRRGYRAFAAPGVREVDERGLLVRDFELPAYFSPSGSPAGKQAGDLGVRDNLGFEALAISPDGRLAWAGLENALVQDGPATGVDTSSPARIVEFDVHSGRPVRQFVYRVEPWPVRPWGWLSKADNGLSELLALDDRHLLALERSFVLGSGLTIKLYRVDPAGATDVSALPSLAGRRYRPAHKSLVADLSGLRNDDGSAVWLDNLEGLTLAGPPGDDRPYLVLVSDNNFFSQQVTQFVALRLVSLKRLAAGRLAGVCPPAARRDALQDAGPITRP